VLFCEDFKNINSTAEIKWLQILQSSKENLKKQNCVPRWKMSLKKIFENEGDYDSDDVICKN